MFWSQGFKYYLYKWWIITQLKNKKCFQKCIFENQIKKIKQVAVETMFERWIIFIDWKSDATFKELNNNHKQNCAMLFMNLSISDSTTCHFFWIEFILIKKALEILMLNLNTFAKLNVIWLENRRII